VSQISAFNPRVTNRTVNLAVTASSTTVSTIPTGGAQVADCNYRIANIGTNVVFIEIGVGTPTAALATSMPLLPNAVESFTGPPGATIAAIAASTGNTIYITPGEGL
jgi:hypothetical protein